MWNPGILIYNLILAGFDCSEAMIKTYDYDISVIVKKRQAILPQLEHDFGDIKKLKKYFPKNIRFNSVDGEVENSFNGNIRELNWK